MPGRRFLPFLLHMQREIDVSTRIRVPISTLSCSGHDSACVVTIRLAIRTGPRRTRREIAIRRSQCRLGDVLRFHRLPIPANANTPEFGGLLLPRPVRTCAGAARTADMSRCPPPAMSRRIERPCAMRPQSVIAVGCHRDRCDPVSPFARPLPSVPSDHSRPARQWQRSTADPVIAMGSRALGCA